MVKTYKYLVKCPLKVPFAKLALVFPYVKGSGTGSPVSLIESSEDALLNTYTPKHSVYRTIHNFYRYTLDRLVGFYWFCCQDQQNQNLACVIQVFKCICLQVLQTSPGLENMHHALTYAFLINSETEWRAISM